MKFKSMLCCIVIFSALTLFPQAADSTEIQIPECSKENLLEGIESENFSVKKQSIYYAGLYRVKEVLPCLIKKLSVEEDPHIRIVIALALYRYNNYAAIRAIDIASIEDPDPHVREVMTSIYREYLDKTYFAQQ